MRGQVTTESLFLLGCNPTQGGNKGNRKEQPWKGRGGQDFSETAGEALRAMNRQDTTTLLPPKLPLRLQKGKSRRSAGRVTWTGPALGASGRLLRTRLGAFRGGEVLYACPWLA